jgi:NADH-quinone oxidoreductase subunit M
MTNLTWLTFLPLIGAAAVLFTPRAAVHAQRMIALASTLVVAVMGVMLYRDFDAGAIGAQHVISVPWFDMRGGLAVHYKLGVDGISMLMVALTALLMPIVILSTWGHIEKRVKEFMVWMLVMETGMLGVFLSLDLVLFYFFWEISLVPLYFMVGIWGGERRIYATIKFFLFTLAGSLVMLVAVIAMLYRFNTSDIPALTDMAASLPARTQSWLFAGFALAFAIKVPVIPFHTWLADAHTEAPTAGSVVLAGVLLKMGTYGLLRFCIAMFPVAAVQWAPLFMVLGAVGIVYGALLSMAQNDLKRLVACSSVSHLGYVILGMFALTSAGLQGGVLQMVSHGMSTGMLFLLVGMIYERRHTRALDEFGGIAQSMPIYALFLVIAVLSSAALPGLNGFIGEYLILKGAFDANRALAVVGVLGVIFGSIYLLMATRKVLFGPITKQANRDLSDLSPREIALMLPIVVFIFWIGVAPTPFLAQSQPAIDSIVRRCDEARAHRFALATPPAETSAALTTTNITR